MYANSPQSITVQDTNTHQYHITRTQDFHPYTKSHDPAVSTAAVLRTSLPTPIPLTTPDPRTRQEART